jgi:hypothetical protein
MKSYKEFINESYFKQVEDLNKLIDPIRDDIVDMLVDFVGYNIKFIPANTFDSSISFELLINRKGYAHNLSYPLPGYKDIDPILISDDILDELVRVCDFIKTEIGFHYTGSYYYYNNSMGFSVHGKDIFKSGGEKVVISISMFFGNSTD